MPEHADIAPDTPPDRTPCRQAPRLWLAGALLIAACTTASPPAPQTPLPDAPTKGLYPAAADVRDSVYLPLDRTGPAPVGYGLYSMLLTRVADRNTVRLLSELFRTTGSAGEAAIARENLNLIVIPVKNSAQAAAALGSARIQPDAAASATMQHHYDFGQAALVLASVCRPERGAAVMKVCGSAAPDGPLLVTTQRPLDGVLAPGQRLLIVNLSTTPPGAVRDVLAAYRRQILRKDYEGRTELEGWRLQALNHVLDAAQLLPGGSKAYAGTR